MADFYNQTVTGVWGISSLFEPTLHLRWRLCMPAPVLQQLWQDQFSPATEWRDIPVVSTDA